jgi:hypothetical protein
MCLTRRSTGHLDHSAPLSESSIRVYPGQVVLVRSLLEFVFVWLASAPFIQPDLVQLLPLLLIVTVTSTIAWVSFNHAPVFAPIPDSLRVQWLRSLGVPATGLSGSLPSLVLLTQPRR